MLPAMAERIGSAGTRCADEQALRAMLQAAILRQGEMMAFDTAKQFADPAPATRLYIKISKA